jgi:rhodanese-related sulfurtransferase
VSGPGQLPAVEVAEAARRLAEDPARPLLVDVREPWEFAAVRAPGAVLLPMSTFNDRVGELPADRPLMVICQSGSRSGAVTGFLTRSGRSDVVNVTGGMAAWQQAGLPVTRGAVAHGEGALPNEQAG